MKPFRVVRYRDVVHGKLGLQPCDMVKAFYNGLARPLLEERERRRGGVRTIAQWEAERKRVRANLIAAIGGPRPAGRLKVEVKGEKRRGPVVVRSVMLSPFRGHAVPANLFLPADAKGPVPVVINPQGHNDQGKNQGGSGPFFACNGYACLTFDFLGAGERTLPGPGGRVFAPAAGLHNIVGTQVSLWGYNLNWFMMYDTMAGIDYVSSLPEIDGTRIGITGASGGGTESFLVTALDERVTVAAPAASVHSFQNTLYPDDAEQTFFDHIERGLDFPDLASFLVAPRPMMVIANTHDIWDLPGTRYVVEQARRFYALHGAKEKLGMRVWDRGHECAGDQMAVILHWFNRWLRHKHVEVTAEAAAKRCPFQERDFLTTRSGCVTGDGYPPARRVFLRQAAPAPERPRATGQSVARWLGKAMGRGPRTVPCEVLDEYTLGGFEAKRIMFAPEPGLWLPADVVWPAEQRRGSRPRKGAMLLIDEIGRQSCVDWQVRAASEGYVAVCPDLRGWGETAFAEQWEEWENRVQTLYNGNRMRQSSLTKLVGRDMAVDRARDVRALVGALPGLGVRGPVGVWGRGSGALVALLAGAADRRIDRLILERLLVSFQDTLKHDTFEHWMDNFVFGTLARGIDVAELCRQFRPRRIEVRGRVDARLRPV